MNLSLKALVLPIIAFIVSFLAFSQNTITGKVLDENLKLELAGINVFNNKFRALPSFPQIGRTITGRLVVNF